MGCVAGAQTVWGVWSTDCMGCVARAGVCSWSTDCIGCVAGAQTVWGVWSTDCMGCVAGAQTVWDV